MSKKKDLARYLQTSFNFDLSLDGHALDSNSAFFEYLKKQLSERIKFLINTDMDKLLQALYRIDVNDRETDRAFALGEIQAVSDRLAELVIRRQMRKLEYAREFNKEDDDGI